MDRRRWWILSTVSLGTFMATLDGSIVNVSLPSIRAAFGIDLPAVEWIVVAYLLVVGATLLPFGRLGEVLSFRTVYLAGFAVFTIASVLCGAAPTALALIIFRAVQGAGAAMIMAMGPAIVARTFPQGERGRALGINAISVSIGLTVGPALGGLLTQLGSWRAIFLVNLPVGIFAIAWSARVLAVEDRRGRPAFDIPGAAAAAGSLFAMLLALTEGETWGWASPAIVGLLGVSIALGVAFVAIERRSASPMLDLSLFGIRAFSAGLASVICAYVGLITVTFLLPFLLQGGDRFSPVEIGLLLTPIPLTTAFVAPFAGTLSDRIGSRLPASLGLAIMARRHRVAHPARAGIQRPRPRRAAGARGRGTGPLHESEQRGGPRGDPAGADGNRVGHGRRDAGRRPGARDRDERGDRRDPGKRPCGHRGRGRDRQPGPGPRDPRRIRRGRRDLLRGDLHEPRPRREAARGRRRGPARRRDRRIARRERPETGAARQRGPADAVPPATGRREPAGSCRG